MNMRIFGIVDVNKLGFKCDALCGYPQRRWLWLQGAEYFAQNAERFMKDIVKLFEEYIPEKLGEVKEAFNDYIDEFKLPFAV